MADTGDLALFKEMFGSFELYLTTDVDQISQKSENYVPSDIQALLDLPFDDTGVQNETESTSSPPPTGPENETGTESAPDSHPMPLLPTALPSKPQCDLPLDTHPMPLLLTLTPVSSEPEFKYVSDSHPMPLLATPVSSKPDCELDTHPIPLLPTPTALSSEPASKSALVMHPVPLLPTPTPLSSEPEVSAPARHKSLSSEQIEKLRGNKYAEKTKLNTKWGVNLFQEWSQEKIGKKIDLQTVTSEEMNEYLKKFYAEAQPKMTNSRKRKFEDRNIASEYHKNTMRNARSAINRYFRENNIKMDISTRNIQFQEANDVLDGKIKSNLKAGLSLPTQHKAVIPMSDLAAINKYLMSDKPVTLRYRAWFILSIQFVSRGLEFHPQLNRNSLQVCRDENNHEYIKLSHGVKEKQHQEGNETANEKRMYTLENGDQLKCPVHNLKEFMSRYFTLFLKPSFFIIFKMSKILTDLSTGSVSQSNAHDSPAENVKSKVEPCPATASSVASASICEEKENLFLSPGFFNPSSCSFSNCTFTINQNAKK